MKKLTMIFSALLLSVSVFAQKAEVKGEQLLIDGQEVAKIEKDGCGAFSPTCNYYINDLSDEPLMTVVAESMSDPDNISDGNSKGTVRYLRFFFNGFDGVAETINPALLALRPKDVAKVIAKAKLIKDGKLDDAAVARFIKINGTRFSDRQKELNPKVIIINHYNR